MKKIEFAGQSKLRARLRELEPIVRSNEKEREEYQRSLDIYRDCYSHALYLRRLKDPLFEPAKNEELFKGQNKLLARLNELEPIVDANKKELAEYEACLKVYRDNENVIAYAISSAMKEGIEEGKAMAKKQGLIEIAHRMKQYGATVEQIKQCTSLTEEEIAQLH